MQTNKGFGVMAVVIAIAIIAAIGGGVYTVKQQSKLKAGAEVEVKMPGDVKEDNVAGHPEEDRDAVDITWKITSAGEKDGMPQTKVAVEVNGKLYETGTFTGSCSEVGAKGGIDGKGLLAGELSAVQCWYAGGGDEIGVFANEDGGVEIMIGGLSEGEEGAGMFRGDFRITSSIKI